MKQQIPLSHILAQMLFKYNNKKSKYFEVFIVKYVYM